MSTLPRDNPRDTTGMAADVSRHPADPVRDVHHEERETERSMKVVSGGTSTEAVLGAAVVVLAILGLAEVQTFYMLTIAAIAAGAALLAEGAAIMARFSKLVHEIDGGRSTRGELGSGMTTELAGGVAAVVLGVLALIGMMPVTLTAIAAIVLGASLLLSSGTTSRLADLELMHTYRRHETMHEVTRQAAMAAAGTQALVGLAAIVLGILALIGFEPVTLTLVALLSVGAALLLSGGAVAGRMASMLGS